MKIIISRVIDLENPGVFDMFNFLNRSIEVFYDPGC